MEIKYLGRNYEIVNLYREMITAMETDSFGIVSILQIITYQVDEKVDVAFRVIYLTETDVDTIFDKVQEVKAERMKKYVSF